LHKSVSNVGEKCNVTSTLDSVLKLALMLCAGAGDTAGKDLAALGDELAKASRILVINVVYLFLTENANLFSSAVSVCGTCGARCALRLSIHNN
jgi:hypothetical protein